MEYKGRYSAFDPALIETYSVKTRSNKVKYSNLIWPDAVMAAPESLPPPTLAVINQVADAIIKAREKSRAVICFSGAHLVKNGMGPILADLIERRVFTLVGGNAATAIHDFELAQSGETSENVPNALPKGQFGMAFEFAWFNAVLKAGNAEKLGFGESLGRAMWDDDFRRRAISLCQPAPPNNAQLRFFHKEASFLSRAYEYKVPVTIHTGIGTDVTDQHLSFDGEAKGGTSGRDFLIYADQATRLREGVVLNIGSAVIGPEVLLKAVSMACNIGKTAEGVTTADFDIRPLMGSHMEKEDQFGYYFRDQKSVVTRVPEAFHGVGHYVQGNQMETVPALYRALRRRLG